MTNLAPINTEKISNFSWKLIIIAESQMYSFLLFICPLNYPKGGIVC